MRCEDVVAMPGKGRVSLGKYVMYGKRAGLRCRATGTARIFILLHKASPGAEERSDPQRWVEDPLESRITQSYHAYSRPTL